MPSGLMVRVLYSRDLITLLQHSLELDRRLSLMHACSCAALAGYSDVSNVIIMEHLGVLNWQRPKPSMAAQ